MSATRTSDGMPVEMRIKNKKIHAIHRIPSFIADRALIEMSNAKEMVPASGRVRRSPGHNVLSHVYTGHRQSMCDVLSNLAFRIRIKPKIAGSGW